MAKINGNEIRPGNVIEHQGTIWRAVKVEHVKPGKGGAFAQVELRNLRNGSKLNERFRSADKVERVRLEQKDQQFLYEQDGLLTFMDSETYDQIGLPADLLGDRRPFLQDGMTVTVEYYDEDELSRLADITGIELETLQDPTPNREAIELLAERIDWFLDEFLNRPELQIERDGKVAADLLVKALQKTLDRLPGGDPIGLTALYEARLAGESPA